MAEGYIYVGGYQPVDGGPLYIKGGKSMRPKERMRAYGTMIPGGLNFMRAAKVDNWSRAEKALLTAISEVEGVEAVGGEWFRCPTIMKLTVLDKLHEIGREVVQVHTFCPAPYADGKRGKRTTRKRYGSR